MIRKRMKEEKEKEEEKKREEYRHGIQTRFVYSIVTEKGSKPIFFFSLIEIDYKILSQFP